jgi:hypothetical protein
MWICVSEQQLFFFSFFAHKKESLVEKASYLNGLKKLCD